MKRQATSRGHKRDPKADPLLQFIRAERKHLGLTQQDIAYMTGLNLETVRNLEQGITSPRLETVRTVLNLLGFKLMAVPLRNLNDPVSE
jgi:transcriptional regulator with XRE-family HTH domain